MLNIGRKALNINIRQRCKKALVVEIIERTLPHNHRRTLLWKLTANCELILIVER